MCVCDSMYQELVHVPFWRCVSHDLQTFLGAVISPSSWVMWWFFRERDHPHDLGTMTIRKTPYLIININHNPIKSHRKFRWNPCKFHKKSYGNSIQSYEIPFNPGKLPLNPGKIPLNPSIIPLNPSKIPWKIPSKILHNFCHQAPGWTMFSLTNRAQVWLCVRRVQRWGCESLLNTWF